MEGNILKPGELTVMLIVVASAAFIVLASSIYWCITSNFSSNAVCFGLLSLPLIIGTIFLAHDCYRAHKKNKLYFE